MKRSHLIRLILFVGVFLRLFTYAYNRSLVHDEGALSINFIRLSFSELTGPLIYDQLAPIGYLWITEAITLALGYSEYALRLFPLFAGLAALPLFYLLAKKILSGSTLVWAMALFALCWPHIFYSSTVKPYSLDLLVGLMLTWAAINLLIKNKKTMHWTLGLGGGLAIWCSFTSVFFLAAIGLILLIKYFSTRSSIRFIPLLSWGIFWLLNIGLYYYFFLRQDIDNNGLQQYHREYFLPLTFWEWSSWEWYFRKYCRLFRDPGGMIFKYLAALLAAIGFIGGFRERRSVKFMLTLPITFAFLASAFGYYSIMARLMLFCVPMLLIFVCKGLEVVEILWKEKNKKFVIPVLPILAALLLLQPILNSIHRLVDPPDKENIRASMDYIVRNGQRGDYLYVYPFAEPQFDYYETRFPLDDFIPVKATTVYENWEADFDRLAGKRVWILLSHYRKANEQDIEMYHSYLKERAQLLDQSIQNGSAALLFEME